ncbi:MAG: S9 family peptidase [Planctomycetota bacterium]
MHAAKTYVSILLATAALACNATPPPLSVAATLAEPVAAVRPTKLEAHGHVRVDEYYWLNERANPEVIRYLEAENAYTAAQTVHTRALRQELFEEIKGRIRQDDSSVPYLEDGYYYYSRLEEGQQYPLYCRKLGSLDAREEVLLNVPAMAEGHAYFSVAGRDVSPDASRLAFGVDTAGRRVYTLYVKDLATGEVLPDTIPGVTGSAVWANDGRTLFYTRRDPDTLRAYQVWRHELGTPVANDVLVFEEEDTTFSCYATKTRSERYLLIHSSQTLSDEVRYLDADDPTGEFQVFLPREREHEYRVDHFGDHFYVQTNDAAKNFRLVRTPVGQTAREHWETVVPHRADVLLEGFLIFQDHLVVSERRDGLNQIQVRPWSGEGAHTLDFGEPAYSARPAANPEFDTPVLRYTYTSLTTPNSTFDYHMGTREKTLMKQDEVLGDFDPDDYVTERLYATARDGTSVPISLVYRRGFTKDGSHPFLLSAYGSYGSSSDARFSSARLSLLDRGFAFGIAHVRGGSEYGRDWYEAGKLFEKKNTFTDFIDCSEHLVAAGYTRPKLLFAEGGSAGGLLMGAIANLRPDLYGGIHAAVPFVDVVTTMLDDTIPLTTFEYDEWGNPNEREAYEYMLSYSPYDQVARQPYPNLLVTTGLEDSQVQYWEPAKWVAKLRARRTNQARLLLKTTMEAGHGGASGRYQRYRDVAFEYAFFLDLARRARE